MSTWHKPVKYKHQITERQTSTTLAGCWLGIEYSNDFIDFKNGVLVENVGYAWDGASGPVFQTEALVDATARHDGLYQVLRSIVGYHPDWIEQCREDADKCLRDDYLALCLKAYSDQTLKHRVSRAIARKRAVYIYWAVRKFGSSRIKT